MSFAMKVLESRNHLIGIVYPFLVNHHALAIIGKQSLLKGTIHYFLSRYFL